MKTVKAWAIVGKYLTIVRSRQEAKAWAMAKERIVRVEIKEIKPKSTHPKRGHVEYLEGCPTCEAVKSAKCRAVKPKRRKK